MKDKAIKKSKRTVKAVMNNHTENGLQVLEAETELAETPLESQIEFIARKIAPSFAGWAKYYVETYEYDLEKAKGTYEFTSENAFSEFLRTKSTDGFHFGQFAAMLEKDPQAVVRGFGLK